MSHCLLGSGSMLCTFNPSLYIGLLKWHLHPVFEKPTQHKIHFLTGASLGLQAKQADTNYQL